MSKSLLKIIQVRIATKIDQEVNILQSGLFRSKTDRWEKVFNLRTKVGTGVLLSYVAFLCLSSSQKESREWKNVRYAWFFLPPDYEDVLKLSGCTTRCTRRDLLCAKTFEKIKSLGHAFIILCHRLGHVRTAAAYALTIGHHWWNVKQSALRNVSSPTWDLKLMVSSWIFSNIIIYL